LVLNSRVNQEQVAKFFWQGRFGNYAYRRRKIDLFSTTSIAIRNNNKIHPLIALMKDQVDSLKSKRNTSLFYQ
jgi:hypothetical protein